MTRQEARRYMIQWQQELIDGGFPIDSDRIQAVRVAIEALQTIDNCDQCEWCCPSDGIPTIHVVRCKDCIHKVVTKDGEYNPEDIVCDYWATDGLTEMDFCTYGERKGGENE